MSRPSKKQSVLTQATARGRRPYQEDRFVHIPDEKGLCFGVFDGHGDSQCSEYLAAHFSAIWHKVIQEQEGEPDWAAVLYTVFARLNQATNWMSCGSTGSVAFIPKDGKQAHVAILGDSPIIVRRQNNSIWVGPEHNVRTNVEEAISARDRGGIIFNGYLYSDTSDLAAGLQMSRAFGDVELNSVLTRVPEVFTHKIGSKSWIMVATDGALDAAHRGGESGLQLAAFIDAGADAQKIVDRALAIPTEDNVTAFLWRNTK